MILSKSGQGFGFVRVLFVGGFFLILFALGLAPFVSSVLIASNTSVLGGFGSFVVDHMALWFLGVFLLVMFVALVYGFSE